MKRQRRNRTRCGYGKCAQLQPLSLPLLGARPLVSVLISSFNYAVYLGAAIESVLEQTYTNLEILICDDGSQDGSQDIIKRYQGVDGRVRAFYQENLGQACALNAAFERSTGEVVCLLDADDSFLPERLQKTVLVQAHQHGMSFFQLLIMRTARELNVAVVKLLQCRRWGIGVRDLLTPSGGDNDPCNRQTAGLHKVSS